MGIDFHFHALGGLASIGPDILRVTDSGWFAPAVGIGCVLAALYVWAPLKTRSSQVKPAEVQFALFEPEWLPPDVWRVFADAAGVLGSIGFQCLGHVGRQEERTAQHGFVSVWVDPVHGDSAQVIGVLTPTPIAHLQTVTLVAFRTEFTDGTTIATSNTKSPGCFPPDKRLSSVACPGVADLALLHQLHRARVEADARGRVATLDRCQVATTRLETEHRETFQRLAGLGYYTLDDQRGQFVPTIRGAFGMTYRLLPPWKQIRLFRRHRLADRTLRRLGFGGLAAFRRQGSSPLNFAA